MRAELFHADGYDEGVIVAFRNFANASKSGGVNDQFLMKLRNWSKPLANQLRDDKIS